jgi:hypothetical protein
MVKQHALWTAVGIWLVVGAGCAAPSSDGSGTGGDGSGGTSSATGGSKGTGGSSSGTGGSSSTGTGGGTTTGTGGSSTTGTGGATGGSPGTGGSTTTGTGASTGLAGSSGKGGTTGTGGTTTATGGAGGKGTGGSGTGGSGTGGTTTGTGGTTTATGGAGGKGTGGTGTGGSATGGATGTGGSAGPCDIWVATTGNDANPGTAALPVATPQAGYELLCPGVTGSANGDPCSGTLKTMCIKAGTYKLATRIEFKKTRMGTASRVITMMADPAATTKPILDFSTQPRLACGVEPTDKNQYGIDIGADYYKVQGLEVTGANDSGILIQGAHDTVQSCDVHDSADTGILISSSSGYTGSGSNETILDCDSHHNNDTQCDGSNADGFAAKKGSGTGNVFDGCRSWDNSDDGFDFYAWTDVVTVKNSWAFGQGASTAGTGSNGNGFKMGGDKVSAAHVMSSCFAFDNNETAGGSHVSDWGFTNNSNPATIKCTGCGAWNNKGGTFQSITHTGDVTASTTTAKASAAKRNADGSLPAITSL